MKKTIVLALLSFNAGFLDTAGFLGLPRVRVDERSDPYCRRPVAACQAGV
jgi:hypothetical protein